MVRARQPAARLVDKTAGCSRDDNERRRPATSGHDGASDEPGAVITAPSRLPAAFETAVTLLSGSRKQKKAGHKRRAGFSGSRTCAPGPGVRAAWHRHNPGACSNARPPFRVLQQRRRNGPLSLKYNERGDRACRRYRRRFKAHRAFCRVYTQFIPARDSKCLVT